MKYSEENVRAQSQTATNKNIKHSLKWRPRVQTSSNTCKLTFQRPSKTIIASQCFNRQLISARSQNSRRSSETWEIRHPTTFDLLTLNRGVAHPLDALVYLPDILQAVLQNGVGLVGGRMGRHADGGQRSRTGQHVQRGQVVVCDDVLVAIHFPAALTTLIYTRHEVHIKRAHNTLLDTRRTCTCIARTQDLLARLVKLQISYNLPTQGEDV